MGEHGAAFQALYADWKLIKTRGVCQVVLEFDISNEHHVYKVLGGMPNPAAEVWVGVACLDLKAGRIDKGTPNTSASQPTTAADAAPTLEDSLNGEPASVGSSARVQNPYSKEAGRLHNDIRFQKWMAENYGIIAAPDACKTKIYDECKITSLKEILPGTDALAIWNNIVARYQAEAHV